MTKRSFTHVSQCPRPHTLPAVAGGLLDGREPAFVKPSGVVVAVLGNAATIHVVDTNNHRIRQIFAKLAPFCRHVTGCVRCFCSRCGTGTGKTGGLG